MGSGMVGSGVDGGRDYALAWWDYVSWIISNRGFFSFLFFLLYSYYVGEGNGCNNFPVCSHISFFAWNVVRSWQFP